MPTVFHRHIRSIMPGMVLCCFAIFGALGATVSSVRALTPNQVAVIINGNIPGSWQVGRYYLKARHIPATHLIVLNLTNHNVNDIPAPYYTLRIANAIKEILRERHLAKQITCLVTTYGIPLRVEPEMPQPEQMRELARVQIDLGRCAHKLRQGIAAMWAIAPVGPALDIGPATTPGAPRTEPAYAQRELAQFRSAASAAIARYQKLPQALRRQESQTFLKLLKIYFGPGGVAQMIHVHGESLKALAQREALQSERAEMQADLQTYQQLAIHRDRAANRQKMRQLQLRIFGLTGLTQELLSDQVYLSQHGRSTALDSDLMMLWYHTKPPIIWQNNPDYLPLWHESNLINGTPRVLMVARLDGLTPDMVIGIIRTSIAAQRRGLHGVAYFDARGLHGQNPYDLFDHDIRATARYLRKHAAINVVINDTPALLQAKNCPRAALYCGWYSPHHYVDSCQWLPGCVGYHVASFELTTLHNPTDTGWCINMLKHGVVGTLGAVAEPYLQAFPKPSLFFPLLLSGRFTQIEVYFLTTPEVGWRIAYVGDPLYNPFQHDPRIAPAELKKTPLFAKAFREIRALHY
ncbi:MAG: TIGR03790 family protein [Planctomycetia bacterium]|nr:TIGR03790 family protein [Planctomycetia bacterium]